MKDPLWKDEHDMMGDKVINVSFFSSRSFMVILSLLILGVGIFILYFWFLAEESPQDLPVIEDANPMIKLKPENPGGIVVPHQDKTIFENLMSDPAVTQDSRLAEGTEAPLETTVLLNNSNGGQEVVTLQTDGKVEVEELGPATIDKVVADVDGTIVKATPPPAPKKPAPVVKKKAIPLKAPAFRVQLGSLKSKNLAEKEWQMLKRNFPKFLKDKDMIISKADLGDKGTYYRIQAGRFNSAAEAKSFCRSLLDAGTGCIPVATSA